MRRTMLDLGAWLPRLHERLEWGNLAKVIFSTRDA